MANIMVIFPGCALSDLDRMTLVEVSEWHQRAWARSEQE